MIEVIKLVVVCIPVAGAIVVMFNAIIMKKQLHVQAYQSVHHVLCAINQSLVQYPEIRQYINGNVPFPDSAHDDFDRAHCMIEMIMDFYDLVYEQRQGMSSKQWNGWKNNIKLVYQTSPGLRDHVNMQGHRYSAGLIKLIGDRDS